MSEIAGWTFFEYNHHYGMTHWIEIANLISTTAMSKLFQFLLLLLLLGVNARRTYGKRPADDAYDSQQQCRGSVHKSNYNCNSNHHNHQSNSPYLPYQQPREETQYHVNFDGRSRCRTGFLTSFIGLL